MDVNELNQHRSTSSRMTHIDLMATLAPLLARADELSCLILECDEATKVMDTTMIEWSLPFITTLWVVSLPTIINAPSLVEVSCAMLTPLSLYHLLANVPHLNELNFFRHNEHHSFEEYDDRQYVSLSQPRPFVTPLMITKLYLDPHVTLPSCNSDHLVCQPTSMSMLMNDNPFDRCYNHYCAMSYAR